MRFCDLKPAFSCFVSALCAFAVPGNVASASEVKFEVLNRTPPDAILRLISQDRNSTVWDTANNEHLRLEKLNSNIARSGTLNLAETNNPTFFSQEFRYVPGAKFPVASNAPAIKPDAPFDFSMFDNAGDDEPKLVKVSVGSLSLTPDGRQPYIDYFTKCIVARLAKNWPKVFDMAELKSMCEISPEVMSQMKFTFVGTSNLSDFSTWDTVFGPCYYLYAYRNSLSVSESEFVQQLVDAGWVQPSEVNSYEHSCNRFLWKNVYRKFKERILETAAKTPIQGNPSLAMFLEKNLVPGFPASAVSLDAKVKASGEILSTHVSQWLNSETDLTATAFDAPRDLDFNTAYDAAAKGAKPNEILTALVSLPSSLASPFIDELAKDPIRKKAVQERLTKFLREACATQENEYYSSCLASAAIQLGSVEYVFEGTSRFAIVNGADQ